MKDGGYLMLATPNYAALEVRIRALLGASNHCDLEGYYNFKYVSPPSLDYIGHVREFTLSEVEQMLLWENFEIMFSQTYTLPVKNATGLRRLMLQTVNFLSGFGRTLGPHIFVMARK